MKYPRLLICFFLLTIPFLLNGQILLRGTVTDSISGQPVPFCSFIVRGTQQGGVADDQGNFSLKVDKLPVTLVINMIGYRTRIIAIRNDQPVRILLEPAAISMRTVTITSDPVTTWHKDDAWNYIDFCFYDNYMLSLVSMTGQNRYYLVLSDTLGISVSTLRIRLKPEKLFTDCLGAVHLYAGDSVYQVYYDYTRLSLPFASSRSRFEQTMLPCACQSGPWYYFTFSSYRGLKQDYYYINWFEQGKYQHFLSIHDSARIVSFNQNYDIRYFLEKRRRQECCAEPVDSITAHLDEYRAQVPLSPRDEQWLTPIVSPIVRFGNYVYILNPLDSVLLTYSGAGNCIRRVKLNCAALPGWKLNELYADEISGALYGRILRSDGCSVFVSIDPQTGNELSRIPIENYPFISQVKIRGGYAYFLWKDPYTGEMTKLRMISLATDQ